MRFLIDEQLPKLLEEWIINKGFDATHVATPGTNTSFSDKKVRRVSMAEKRIVITNDEDFFNSYVFQREPYKLIFITKEIAKIKLCWICFAHNLTIYANC